MAQPDPLIQQLDAAYRSGDVDVPKGWEPYAEIVGQIGSAIVTLPRPDATERDLLLASGYDPADWRINGAITTRRWQNRSKYDHVPQWLTGYKFDVIQGESPEEVELHVDDLVKHIRRRRPAPKAAPTGKDGWTFVAADWQIGKREGADGTPQTVDRVVQSIELGKKQVKELRRIGRRMPEGLFLGTGDLVEGCIGFYASQQFVVDATRREQNKITRELVTYAVDELSPLFEVFKAATVGGNHGENRSNGKAFTDDSDNDDVACFEAAREAFDRAGSDVEWIIPHDELAILIELGGVPIGATHGHLFGGGATPQKKAYEWWKGQEFGMSAIRGARILVSSHYHHWLLSTYGGGRTHMQTPAMDPGSKWFRDLRGEDSPAGALTFRVDAEEALGYADLQILSPRKAA